MAVISAPRAWEELFAARTRGGVGEGIAEILGLLAVPGLISFAGGFPDPRTFPRERASQLLAEFAETGEASAFQYAPTRGLAGPLDAVAGRIESAQGRRPADDELMITSGSIEALELTGKTFLDTGDTVAVEGPTYLGALMAFRGFAAEIAVVPLDDDGLQVDELERQLAGGLKPKLLYTIPDHQNPAGVSMSTERREALVALARRYGFVIFEDVAYRELDLGEESLPSLWSLAPDVVVQAGTTSKTFFPGVRLGWAASPASISSQLVSAKQNTDQCAGALGQRFFEEYVRRGYLDEQLAASNALYRMKRDCMLAALEQSMPDHVRWTSPRGGFFTWLTLLRGDASSLAAAAVAAGVGIVPGSLFYPDGRGNDNVRLSFSLVDESQIAAGIATLATLA
ncbi:MAG TPA: PLP-dependent aminotransferase family protein [Gaiellaceae bacterium]